MTKPISITKVFFRPPFAIARLGRSAYPLENFEYRDSPGVARTVQPTVTLRMIEDGSVSPYLPDSIRFHDDLLPRPIAPFFELWATILDPTASDSPKDVPLTSALLRKAGGRMNDILYTVQVSNQKAVRRTGDPANAFESVVKVDGLNYGQHKLLAYTPPQPNRIPLVFPDQPIFLGALDVVRPREGCSLGVDLDVLRLRFTPAKGEVYGPREAKVTKGITGSPQQNVPIENRILNPEASWSCCDGGFMDYFKSELSSSCAGSDQDQDLSPGVVDDTCDGTIQALIIAKDTRFMAWTRICAVSPYVAPDQSRLTVHVSSSIPETHVSMVPHHHVIQDPDS